MEERSITEDTDEGAGAAAALLRDLDRLEGVGCVACSRRLCGHEALFSVFMGLKDAPRCLPCLAGGVGRAPAGLRDDLADYFAHRDCYRQAWAAATEREGLATERPACLWPGGEGAATPRPSPDAPPPAPAPAPPADEWDAGHMACGDLVLALRVRLRSVSPGGALRVTARDPAAPEDLPAWCRLTGHRLLDADHPHYLIQRKET